MDAAQFLIALKKAMPYIGRTDTKVLVALAGMPRPISYDQITLLMGTPPHGCLEIMRQSGFISKDANDLYLLNPAVQWNPASVKNIRHNMNAVQSESYQRNLERKAARKELAEKQERARLAKKKTNLKKEKVIA